MDVYRCPRCEGVAFTLDPDHRFAICNKCQLAVDVRFANVLPLLVTGYNDDDAEGAAYR